MRVLAILGIVTVAAQGADSKFALPDAPGKQVTAKLCGTCHGAEIVLGKPHSEEGWTAVVTDMVQRGAQGSEEELYDVVQYLTRNIKALPKVNLNKATAAELQSDLGFNEKEAQAVAAEREKAPFKNIDDLKRAGIPAGKLTVLKGRVSF